MCREFTNNKSCKIPAIWEARVCDGIEFSLALSQYSQWRIILHGSRNRHFYVLLIFYLKLNCRYRVINKIHPCLSHTNSFLSKVFSWLCLGKLWVAWWQVQWKWGSGWHCPEAQFLVMVLLRPLPLLVSAGPAALTSYCDVPTVCSVGTVLGLE